MLLIFSGIMIAGASFLWQSAVNTAALEKDSLRAFYLAQAGIERGRMEIAFINDPDWAGNFSNQTFTTFANGHYNITITRIDTDTKDILSTGVFGNSTRIIKMRVVDDTVHGLSPPYGNAWGYWANHENAWQEQ